MHTPHINLVLGWSWILLGFVSGTILGMFFRRENWLGGYSSFKRRLYRLCHISFFGLGAVNLFFDLTLANGPTGMAAGHSAMAGWALIVGAISMPAGCALVANYPRAHMVFSVPVVSLLFGGVLLALSMTGRRMNLEQRGSAPVATETFEPNTSGPAGR